MLTWTPYVDVAQPHVQSDLTSDKSSLCPKDRRLWRPYTRSWRCEVKDFCHCREYNCDSSVNKTEDKLSVFKNGIRLNSIQHRTSSEPVISSTSQVKAGTLWNQKIQQRVQNSQPTVPILSQVNHGKTFRYHFWKINTFIIFPSAPRSSKCLLPSRFPSKTLYVSLVSPCLPRPFLPLIILH